MASLDSIKIVSTGNSLGTWNINEYEIPQLNVS